MAVVDIGSVVGSGLAVSSARSAAAMTGPIRLVVVYDSVRHSRQGIGLARVLVEPEASQFLPS